MLYPVLHRLERRGLIKARWGESETGRKRKYYSLKKDGKTAMNEHHEQWSLVHAVCPACERSNMFNLEHAIADWRRQMLATGIKTPAPLEELEGHLREEIDQQMKSGLGSDRAFEIAAAKIGPPAALENEFKQGGNWRGARFVELAGIACGAVAGFFLLWTICVFLFIREANWTSRAFGILALARGLGLATRRQVSPSHSPAENPRRSRAFGGRGGLPGNIAVH